MAALEDDEVLNEDLYDMSDEELEAAFKAQSRNKPVEDTHEAQDEGKEEDVQIDEDEPEKDEEETEVELGEDTEQPDEDSDDKVDDDEDEGESEDESTETPDEEKEDTQPTEVAKSEQSAPKTHKFKANGQEFEFTEREIQEQFGRVFGQAMNYTQKMQEISPWRKTISALKEGGMTHDDVNLMLDALNGSKEAISAVLQRAKVDAMDLDPDAAAGYRAREYGRSERELAIDEVRSVISRDPEYKITQHVVDEQWDSASRAVMAERPEYIEGLHADIKSGVFDAVSPMAMKLKVLDGAKKPDIDYYIDAGKQYYGALQQTQAQEQERLLASRQAEYDAAAARKQQAEEKQRKLDEVKQREAKQKETKSAANKRRAASPTRANAGTKDVVDYLDEVSEEDFQAWYERVQNS